jgi:hypothetical protein
MLSIATAQKCHIKYAQSKHCNTRLRELHNETPKDDAHTSSLLHFQRAAILAIWQLPSKQPPEPRLLDQEEQRILKEAVKVWLLRHATIAIDST